MKASQHILRIKRDDVTLVFAKITSGQNTGSYRLRTYFLGRVKSQKNYHTKSALKAHRGVIAFRDGGYEHFMNFWAPATA